MPDLREPKHLQQRMSRITSQMVTKIITMTLTMVMIMDAMAGRKDHLTDAQTSHSNGSVTSDHGY